MKAAALTLEDFGAGAPAARGRSREAEAAALAAAAEARAEGYAEGFAEALSGAEAEDRAAVAQLRESLQDMELTLSAARAEAVAQMRGVVEALAAIAAPQAAAAGFAAELAEAVAQRLAAAPQEPLTVRAAEARVAGLRARFGDRVAVEADPAMVGAQARLDWPGGGARYDVEACLDAARAAIARFFGDQDGKERQDVG
jgi:flagellar biosynthesis/type III secretory pathway protein FliH